MSDPSLPPRIHPLARLYRRCVFDGPMPWVIVSVTLAVTVFFAWRIKDFEMDATPDSIVLESDKDLRYYDDSRLLFGADEFVVVVFQIPSVDALVSDKYVAIGREISEELRKVDNVETVLSYVDVPLFHSPDIPIVQLVQKGYNTLLSPAVDRKLAGKELLESPLYRDYLLSVDNKGLVTTAIFVNFDPDRDFLKLEKERAALKDKKAGAGLAPDEVRRLKDLDAQWKSHHAQYTRTRQKSVHEIKALQKRFQEKYPELKPIYQSGITLVIADMVDYIRRDIFVFGAGALIFMFMALWVIFRSLRWELLLVSTCLATSLIMVGYVSYVHWQTTVVTANFSSLLLILTMSSAVHIVEHFLELQSHRPDLQPKDLALQTVQYVFWPILFMVFTTIIGFGSLVLSGIRPVMDFGLVMSAGLVVSLFMCLFFLPPAITIISPPAVDLSLVEKIERLNALPFIVGTRGRRLSVLAVSLAVLILGAIGASRLTVEMRFLDYFRESTEICRGMTLIDTRMGGTMPLEVVLDGKGKDYWKQPENLARLRKVHEFIDDLPDTGGTISLETFRRILVGVNKGKEINPAFIDMALKAIPENMRRLIIDPYVTVKNEYAEDFSKARIVIRVRESDKRLRREDLRRKIATFLEKDMGFKLGENGDAHITGYFVLYNNMLQTLFSSQINTLGSVFITVFITFLIIFRSLKLAVIGLAPNIMAVIAVLGVIGWLGIPLDMMTIMIAAVTFGMADDNTIHYIVRFQHEFPKDRDYLATMRRCHDTVGRAVSFSLVTVVAGFAILGASNFVPTAYFGLFTGVAMFVALLTAHSVLPTLMFIFKPFGKDEGGSINESASNASTDPHS